MPSNTGPMIPSLAEWGYTSRRAPARTELPPGGGKWAVPHFLTYAGVPNLGSRTYRWWFDEALRNCQQDARAMRNDPVCMEALRARQMPVVQFAWHFQPEDEDDPAQVVGAEKLTRILERTPRLQAIFMWMLEALWYGRYGVMLKYEWKFRNGEQYCEIVDSFPLNGDKLVFSYDGYAGVLMNAAFGNMDGLIPTDRGMCHFFTDDERESVLIHEHEPEDSDYWDNDTAGRVHGHGLRSRIYWWWHLKANTLAWLTNYLQKVGAGGWFVWFYEAGNQESYNEVAQAAEQQSQNSVILMPKYKDGTEGPGIQRIEVGTAGAQLLESLITGYYDDIIRLMILGQTLTSGTAATGLGSGVAEAHEATFARINRYDAVNLQDTINRELVPVLAAYNCPGIPTPRFQFNLDVPDVQEYMSAAQMAYSMGASIDETDLRSALGLAEPRPGRPVLSAIQSMNPAAMGGTPGGVPMYPGAPAPGGGDGSDPSQDPQAGGQGDPGQAAALPPGSGPQGAFRFNRRGRYVQYGRRLEKPMGRQRKSFLVGSGA